MKTHPLILDFQFTVRLPEIIIFLLGALVLGFTIHYFWSAKKAIKMDEAAPTSQEGIDENDNWKLKYYNDMDMQEKSLQQLRERLAEAQENEQILSIEVEELQKQVKGMESRPLPETKPAEVTSSSDYLTQLKNAQENLFQHNQHVNRLLEQIQLLKESEKKYLDLQKTNTQLSEQLSDLNKSVIEKDAEISRIRQHQRLTDEISDRMDKAYSEFNVLQEKLQRLEGYLNQPHSKKIDYDELHKSYFRLTRDFDEAKTKQSSMWDENQRLSRILADTEDKLREANFQRQQLLRKVQFLEELNKDLQDVSEHNKKLEGQLRRISEMESLLSKISPEKKDFHSDPGQL
jgi:DNA repair exonuclease SbcCD ATPase subunit